MLYIINGQAEQETAFYNDDFCEARQLQTIVRKKTGIPLQCLEKNYQFVIINMIFKRVSLRKLLFTKGVAC